MNKELKIGRKYVLEMDGRTFVGTLYWSDRERHRFVLEFHDRFMYHQRVYFTNARYLKPLEISKCEFIKNGSKFIRNA